MINGTNKGNIFGTARLVQTPSKGHVSCFIEEPYASLFNLHPASECVQKLAERHQLFLPLGEAEALSDQSLESALPL